MKTGMLLLLASTLLSSIASANTIETWVGDRKVLFKLVQKDGQTILQTVSDDVKRPGLVLNAKNKKFYVDALKKACNRTEYEVNTRSYQIEINREENGKQIRCIYGFNSTSPKAGVARNALDVLAVAVNVADRIPAASPK